MKPLSGLKVIELQAIGPVPFAGQLLQQLGAIVTRVCAPDDPGLGIAIAPEHDALNIGKARWVLNLKDRDHRNQLLEGLKSTHVVLEGFRPGTLERLHLAPDDLLKINSDLVIGRLNGWGSRGPWAARAGHDINYLGLTGALLAIGTKEQPVPPLNLIADFGGGAMHLVVGVLAKLTQRAINPQSETARGGVVDTSILAGTHGLTGMFHGLLAAGMHRIQREANLLDGGLPFYRVYACEDGFMAVGALESKFYSQLLSVLGIETQVAVKDQYNPATWTSTRDLFAKALLSKTRGEWTEIALMHDCCLSPVLSFAEAQTDAHNLANDWFATGSVPSNVIRFN